MDLPPEVAAKVEELRAWAREHGSKAGCALFCAFHPLLVEIEGRVRLHEGGYNPTGVDDIELGRARRTLVALRDAFLMPSLWDSESTVLLTHTIALLHRVLSDCLQTGLETDGVGEETG
jgi:hypothetical protein